MEQKPDVPPAWIVDTHNLPLNALRERQALDVLHQTFRAPSVFLADRLFTFGRNLTFLKDSQFLDAFQAAEPDRTERGLIWRKHILYWAARRALYLEGDFVEAACYQGFSARVVADAVGLAGTDRNYWLYDRFDVPEQGRLIHHCEDLHERVVARFADLANARIVKGSMPDSFAQGVPDRISFLHLDMNNAASEIAALEVLDDRMAPGGVIVLDDHGWATYRAQKDAEDDWFRARGKMVLEMPTGQGLVIR